LLPANWGLLIQAPVLLYNLSSGSRNSQMGLALSGANAGITNFGQVMLDLGPDLFARWQANGAVAPGFQTNAGSTALTLVGTSGTVLNLLLAPAEINQVQVKLLLRAGYPNPVGQVFNVDLTQYDAGLPGVPPQVVGGQRFVFDFDRMRFVPPGSLWRYMPTNQLPDPNWNQVAYDDSHWLSGEAKLGWGIGNEATVIDGGPTNNPYITTWFRYDFALRDLNVYSNLWLELKAHDGAVVYLNGVEIQRLNMPPGPVTPTTLALHPVTGEATDTFFPFDVSSFLPLLAPSNVVAVEVHRSDPNAASLGFDLQLDANLFAPNFSPQVAFLSPANGALFLQGRPILLTAEPIGLPGPIVSVSYYDRLQLIGTSTNAPYGITWSNAPLGTRALTAVATDAAGRTGNGFASVQVVTNVPPTIAITSPIQAQIFPTNATIAFSADARKNGGTIQQVEFFMMRRGPGFMNPLASLGTVTAPPYQLQFNIPTNGVYMLSAVASDNAGVESYSTPLTIFVASMTPPSLSISNAPPFIILNWTPTNAVLQQATSPAGPWQTLTNATPPYGFVPAAAVPIRFYRVFLSSSQLQLSADVICGPAGK